jgi:hypothetical protein
MAPSLKKPSTSLQTSRDLPDLLHTAFTTRWASASDKENSKRFHGGSVNVEFSLSHKATEWKKESTPIGSVVANE